MIDWVQWLGARRTSVALKTFSPASEASLADARARVGGLPPALEDFYRATNGATAGSFKLLPVEDVRDIKRTWDSLQRANDPKSTRFLGRSDVLLRRFLLFADIGAGRAGAIDRSDGSIWYEEDGQLRQTDLSLDGFIEANLRDLAGI